MWTQIRLLLQEVSDLGQHCLSMTNKLKIEPDFPSLADEIAEPCPDMNSKVTAFTVSKMLYYTLTVVTQTRIEWFRPKINPLTPLPRGGGYSDMFTHT